MQFSDGETDNWLSDFYYVAIIHLLNPCNRKNKHDLHNKIWMCKETYRESAELSEEETTSMNWENLCNWYKLNLNKHCLEITQQKRTLVLISFFGMSVAEVLQVSTTFMFAARPPESGKWIAAELTSSSVCLATQRLTRVVDKTDAEIGAHRLNMGRGWTWEGRVRRRGDAIKHVVEEDTFPSLFQLYHLQDDVCIHTLPERHLWNPIRQKKECWLGLHHKRDIHCSLQALFLPPPQKILLLFYEWEGSFPPVCDVISSWWKESSAGLIANVTKCNQNPVIHTLSHQTDRAYGTRGWLSVFSASGHGGGHSFKTLWGYENGLSMVWTCL